MTEIGPDDESVTIPSENDEAWAAQAVPIGTDGMAWRIPGGIVAEMCSQCSVLGGHADDCSEKDGK